jgi:antitoxin MazE
MYIYCRYNPLERIFMKTEFVRWGNSLALRIPAAFAKEVGATEGKPAEMTVEDDALIIKVVRPRSRRRYRLEELVDRITEENRHAETDWGPAVGAEVW